MGKVIVVLKAILTRVIFGAHGFLAIWRVTMIKKDPYYWYLMASVLALGFEGIFTLTIKKNQEWKWFCPSVFFYLCSVVPAIWLIEVDKFDAKLAILDRGDELAAQGINLNNLTAVSKDDIPGLETFGVDLKIPVQLDAEMWATVIEQFLMLILIIGRWMLPKGGLTRDQLSQLLLVYIGTAADIIEFFDSFKDDKISRHRILCLLILSIWSWSLLQFTFVLTATKARRARISTTEVKETPKLKIVNGIIKVKEVCCNIDVWAILINIILQDAPFLIFRALLILYYKIISYMNIFFTCKNTLVIILQFYRLYVVQQEKNKELSKIQKAAVSKNVANAVERAAGRMGPEGRARLVKNAASGKRSGKGPSSKQTQNKNKHRSQDSISSQNTNNTNNTSNTNRSAPRRDRNGRRRSLSTGNLPEVGEGETFEDRIYEDDIELGMSGSALSGTNDPDSQEEDEESEVPQDELSNESERPRGPRKNIRMSENPGIYKISGSRSSGSSERGHGRYRQDTGYSSSSKDSGNSGGRRGRSQHSNGGGGGGRHSGRPLPNNRSRSSAQRRRQFISSKNCNSFEMGDYEGMLLDQLGGLSIEDEEEALENERLWQRRVAIGAVFFLFVVIFILVMVAIYGGINPRGLVLRENFRIRKTTRPTTTPTPEPTTEVVITSTAMHNKSVYTPTSAKGVVPVASLSPLGEDAESNKTVEQLNLNITNLNTTTLLNETVDSLGEHGVVATTNNYDNVSINFSNLESAVDTDSSNETGFRYSKNIVLETTTTPAMEVEGGDVTISSLSEVTGNNNKNLGSSTTPHNYGHYTSAGSHHNLRHRISRIFRFVSEGERSDYELRRNRKIWKLSRGMSSFL